MAQRAVVLVFIGKPDRHRSFERAKERRTGFLRTGYGGQLKDSRSSISLSEKEIACIYTRRRGEMSVASRYLLDSGHSFLNLLVPFKKKPAI